MESWKVESLLNNRLIFHLQRSTFNVQPSLLQRSTFNLQPSTFTPSTFNLQPSTFTPSTFNPSQTQTMTATYNPYLVVLSAFIAVLASYTALELSSRVTAARGFTRRLWLLGGAIAMGTGIWSMHFIAMLAFSIPLFISYNLGIVLVSLIAAILASAQALFIIGRPKPSPVVLLAGSSCMGVGIAIMHYTGMAAMQMPAMVNYKPSLFLLSVVIAIVVSLVALKLSIQFREGAWVGRKWLKIVTACIMGGAVLSMHYTGMAAAMFKPDLSKLVQAAGLDNLSLAYIVCLFTLLIMSLTLATIYINNSGPRRLLD